jgi:hypothetical protein
LTLADPVNQARESWLEWHHLEVRNQRQRFARTTRPAHDVALQVTVDGRGPSYSLVRSGSTPGNVITHLDVRADFPCRAPLVLRTAEGAEDARAFLTAPLPNTCHLTELEFVTQGVPAPGRGDGIVLAPGQHALDVVVHDGDGERLPPRRFVVTVPADSLLRLDTRAL